MRFYPEALDRVGVGSWIDRNRRRYRDDGHGLWAMVLKSSGEVIGDCGLTRQTVDGVGEIEIGYHVRRDLWGREGLLPRRLVRAATTDSRARRRAADFAHPAEEFSFASGGGESGAGFVERSNVEGFATLRVRDSEYCAFLATPDRSPALQRSQAVRMPVPVRTAEICPLPVGGPGETRKPLSYVRPGQPMAVLPTC
jgi:hypothetical protein